MPMSTRAPLNSIPTGPDKAPFVHRLFSQVAPTYDLLNRVLSAGQDRGWRRAAARRANLNPGDRALDVATGTGDLARELKSIVGAEGLVVGLDFCRPMLTLAIERNRLAHADVPYVEGDAMNLPFGDNTFNASTIAFGARNVIDLPRLFREMTRVARPNGRVVCLEISRPVMPGLKQAFHLYFSRILPWIARLFHSRRSNYAYLPASLAIFPERDEVARMMSSAGLCDVTVTNLAGGIVAVFTGRKPETEG